MACPCCGPKWECFQCCCPDGSEPPQSLAVRVEKSNSFRVPYDIFEGTHTLNPLVAPPLIEHNGRYGIPTCVEYIKQVPGGCNGATLSLQILFTLYLNQQRVPEQLVTTWWWSGIDDMNRCVTLYGTSPRTFAATQVANVCGGPKGLLLPDVQFFLNASGGAVARAAFDVYID